MPGSSGATKISSVGSHSGGGGQGGIDGCVTNRATGIQVLGSLASVGLKLAKIRIDGGSEPRVVAGAVKCPAVTITRSRISVPLANPRSSTGFPVSSTRQTMITPTWGYLFSTSMVVCAETGDGPHHSAIVHATVVRSGSLLRPMMSPKAPPLSDSNPLLA